MSEQLKTFVHHVLHVTPQYIDIFGNGLPGMAGRSAATAGAANAGADTAQKLHHAAIAFARTYNDPRSDEDDVRARAKEVEGLLMASVTLSVLSEGDGVRLIDELQALLDQKPQQVDAMHDNA